MAEIHEGGCLCGKIRYRVIGNPNWATVCHCTSCKRRTSSAFSVAAHFDESSVQFTTDAALKSYEFRSDESNRWVKLEFCPHCGTTVTCTAEVAPGARSITGGTFDDPNWIKPFAHFWTRSALHWVVFPANVEIFKKDPSEAKNA